jgi:hypothetical protein
MKNKWRLPTRDQHIGGGGVNYSVDSQSIEATALKCATLLLLAFYGEPDLMGAVIDLIGRLAS